MSLETRPDVSETADALFDIYRTMLLSRRFDERCNAMLERGEPVPHFHSGVGQEALSVGSVARLRPSDQIIYTHRGIGHLLGKGVSLREIVLDMFMVRGGTNHGFGSVLHVSRPDIGLPGREGVFGTRFGIAVGLALAITRRKQDDVVVCFYGEAAGSRGALYEALNMAVLWSLPIIFVGENNGWSFSSRTEWLYPEARMSRVWRGFEIPVHEMDGNDVEEVATQVAAAVAFARTGNGPSVLEGLTQRMDPHIYWDKQDYRTVDELEPWRRADPVERTKARLLALGAAQDAVDALEASVAEELDAAFGALAEAEAPEWPT